MKTNVDMRFDSGGAFFVWASATSLIQILVIIIMVQVIR